MASVDQTDAARVDVTDAGNLPGYGERWQVDDRNARQRRNRLASAISQKEHQQQHAELTDRGVLTTR
jgi:hypothetical protein